MPERIHKLQPNRNIQLRGFDDLGAAAALHSATADSFKVSGIFRDAADFAVLVLYDADNFYEHPSLKYLPDTNFAGITLIFDVHYAGLQPLDSVKFPTISWPFLEVIRPDGSTAAKRLSTYATQAGGEYTKAQTTISVSAAPAAPQDRVTIWFQNWAFDYRVGDTGGQTADQVAAALAQNINSTDWGEAQAIEAEANGAEITIRAAKPGRDGNMITLYTESATETLKLTPASAKLSGGSSDATWRVTLNFPDLEISDIRQCWLTFAPELADGAAFVDKEWEATFTNWTVSGDKKWLRLAGPGSLRIEESESVCRYTGNSWSVEPGFYSSGFARAATVAGDSVTIDYSCPWEHELWVGTRLYPGGGSWNVTLDGAVLAPLSTVLHVPNPETAEPVNTRRPVSQAVAAGRHTLTLQLGSGTAYFDFVEAVIPSDYFPEPRTLERDLAPALDYSTDHTYKLPPTRVLWMFDQLGFGGPLNLYMGVFWYNQRKRVDGTPWGLTPLLIPSVTVTFTGEFQTDDQAIIEIGGQPIGKTVFPLEANSPGSIAKHFEHFINSNYVGVWAVADDNTLTITARSPKAAYSYSFRAWVERKIDGAYAPLRDLDWSGSLEGGGPGIWQVDPEQDHGINAGARAWLSDMFLQLAQRGREMVVATSMELVFPPPNFAAKFPDGNEAATDVGFGGSLRSIHCGFNSLMRTHHAKVYRTLAGLMQAAGMTPNLQFGEFLWWFFSRKGLKPVAVSNTTPIEIYFSAPHGMNTGDRLLNAGYEGCTAANGTWTITVVNENQVALNGTAGNGAWTSGTGFTKTGGMAYYDDETKAAAQAALGRPLHEFQLPTDDPNINGGADARFLRDRLGDYVAALIAEVRTAYPATLFELLWPYDVNYPTLTGIHGLGGSLNRFVNLPIEWEQKQTSGLDRLKIEALDFGSTRNLDMARTAIRFPFDLGGWPRDSLRYLVPIFRAGYGWEREYRTATGLGYPAVNLWAFDHVCIYGLTLSPPQARALYMG